MIRRQAVRQYYLWLHCGSHKGVRECPMTDHPLYPYRLNKLPKDKTGLDRAKAIRKNCLMCAGSCKGVNECNFKECSLFKFRFGYR